MDENTSRLANELRQNPAMLQSLMRSSDGQALLRMLTQKDQGAGLQKAVQSAVQGDTTQMVEMIRSIMNSPDGAALVERINQATRK